MALPPGVSFEERPNFTAEQAKEILDAAIEMTLDLTGSEPKADAVFTSAVQMLSNKQVIQVQAPLLGLATPLNRH